MNIDKNDEPQTEFARKFIAVYVRQQKIYLAAHHVRCLHAEDKILTLRTVQSETYHVSGTIKAMLDRFPEIWTQVHRAWAVRMQDIVKVAGECAYLVDGTTVPVSERMGAALMTGYYQPSARAHRGIRSATPKVYGPDEGLRLHKR